MSTKNTKIRHKLKDNIFLCTLSPFIFFVIFVDLKRDGVCNPVTHVLKAIEVFKRFGRGCHLKKTTGPDTRQTPHLAFENMLLSAATFRHFFRAFRVFRGLEFCKVLGAYLTEVSTTLSEMKKT